MQAQYLVPAGPASPKGEVRQERYQDMFDDADHCKVGSGVGLPVEYQRVAQCFPVQGV